MLSQSNFFERTNYSGNTMPIEVFKIITSYLEFDLIHFSAADKAIYAKIKNAYPHSYELAKEGLGLKSKLDGFTPYILQEFFAAKVGDTIYVSCGVAIGYVINLAYQGKDYGMTGIGAVICVGGVIAYQCLNLFAKKNQKHLTELEKQLVVVTNKFNSAII